MNKKTKKLARGSLLFEKIVIQYSPYLPVAQLDSASDSDSEGRRFESCRVGQKTVPALVAGTVFLIYRSEPVAQAMQVRIPPSGGITSEASYSVG